VRAAVNLEAAQDRRLFHAALADVPVGHYNALLTFEPAEELTRIETKKRRIDA
jgi:hypothetical protein